MENTQTQNKKNKITSRLNGYIPSFIKKLFAAETGLTVFLVSIIIATSTILYLTPSEKQQLYIKKGEIEEQLVNITQKGDVKRAEIVELGQEYSNKNLELIQVNKEIGSFMESGKL